MPENIICPDKNRQSSQSTDLNKIDLPKPVVTTSTLDTKTTVITSDHINLAKQKVSIDLKTIDPNLEKNIELNPRIETETKTERSEPSTAPVKKRSSGITLPILIKDPIGFLAAVLKKMEQALLGALNELNQKPELSKVKINLDPEGRENKLTEKEQIELTAKALREKAILAGRAQNGAMLFEHKLADDDSDDDKKNK